jgi:8-oxo-dGTP diphosphatase
MLTSREKRSTQAENDRVELAAGGLVWRRGSAEERVAVIHRSKHQDWTLPKGRREPDESIQETATREAMEETGFKVKPASWAGAYTYLKNDQPKVVLMWHMHGEPEEYSKPAPSDEVAECVWLPVREAIERLTHASEKEFLARNGGGLAKSHLFKSFWKRNRDERLESAIRSVRAQFRGYLAELPDQIHEWWVDCASQSLSQAESSLARHERATAWNALHDAERFLIFGMSDSELRVRAITLETEARKKIGGWRGEAIATLFATVSLPDLVKLKSSDHFDKEDRVQLQRVVAESLGIVREGGQNTYHRLDMIRSHLLLLVVVCSILVGGVLLCSYWFPEHSPLSFDKLLAISLSGAFGAMVSAMYQLSRLSDMKIPEVLLTKSITWGRPVIGAVSALFVYFVLRSGIITLIKGDNEMFLPALVLGFIAGFSESFVLNTVAKVSGTSEREKAGSGARSKKN